MDGLLLYTVDAQSLQFSVEDLAEVHHNRLVDLLPQVRPEDLNQRYFERRDFAVKENAC